jgi:hypothetical protein
MSTSSSNIKPIFSNESEEPLLAKPVSKLAMLALLLGIASLISLISPPLLPLAILACFIGLFVSVRAVLSKQEFSGAWMANVGLLLAVVSASWTYLANSSRNEFIGKHAAEYAKHYLETVSRGEIYKAAELQLPFTQRQLPGLDLADYYEAYKGPISDEVLFGDKTYNASAHVKKRLNELRANPAHVHLLAQPGSKWDFVELRSIATTSNSQLLATVVMANSLQPDDRIAVTLSRQTTLEKGTQVNDWSIKELAVLQ